MTTEDFLNQRTRQAVHDEYKCPNIYGGRQEVCHPCPRYEQCRWGSGCNRSYDVDDDCMAEEYGNGFRAGWLAAMKHLYYGGITLDNIVTEISEYVELAKKEE